jgi:GMP synthase-like glutamine amidotransferase
MGNRPGIIIQHDPTGGAGLLAEWLDREGVPYEVVRLWEGQQLPETNGWSFITSLGSVSSVRDTEPAWVPAEIEFLRRAIATDVPVLGLCFGGQALSAALGGGVDHMDRPEIGWFPADSEVDWLPSGPWVQYHKEVLRIPASARRLAAVSARPAAFSVGPHLGLQFHAEATPAMVDQWAALDPDLKAAGITRDQLASQGARCEAPAREAAFELFEGWWERGPGRAP